MELARALWLRNQQLIDSVFARAVAGDPERVVAVGRFDGAVRFAGAELLFTLPELPRFLLIDWARSGHDPRVAEVANYKAFRGMLYHGRTNAELRRFGAVVGVERADADHAHSLYRLTRRNG